MLSDEMTKSINCLTSALKDIGIANNKAIGNLLSEIQSCVSESQTQMFEAVNNLSKMLCEIKIIDLTKPLRDMFSTLNFENIFKGTVFEENITSLDKETSEILIKDSVATIEKINEKQTLSVNEKKSFLRKFLSCLKMVLSSGLFALFLFLISPIYQDVYNEKIKPAVFYNQYTQIQKLNIDLDLRILKKDAYLFRSRNMKTIITKLSKYEIVEVLEYYYDRIKVKVYNSDEIGWIYKKYSKK